MLIEFSNDAARYSHLWNSYASLRQMESIRCCTQKRLFPFQSNVLFQLMTRRTKSDKITRASLADSHEAGLQYQPDTREASSYQGHPSIRAHPHFVLCHSQPEYMFTRQDSCLTMLIRRQQLVRIYYLEKALLSLISSFHQIRCCPSNHSSIYYTDCIAICAPDSCLSDVISFPDHT